MYENLNGGIQLDKVTKDALTKSKKSLSNEALEKRKEINKKILRFFGYAILLLILTVIIGSIFSKNSEEKIQNDNGVLLAQPSNEPSQKAKPFLQTRKNIQLVIESLDKNYGIKAKNEYLKDYCLNDTFCEVYASTVQIQAIGYKVDPLSSTQVTPAYYQQVCSAVLSALSNGANQELVEQTIFQYFNYAAQNGSARSNILGVDTRISPDSRGILQCHFVKKW